MNDRSKADQAPISPLSLDQLRRRCDTALFSFETTQDIEPLDGFMGQNRALDAIEFGTSIERSGFNIFVLGTPGTGRHTAVKEYLTKLAAKRSPSPDWVYVNNFDGPQKPRALSLPTGRAVELKDGMSVALEDLAAALPAVFESDEYRRRRRAVDEEFEEAQETAFEKLRKKAEERNVAVLRTPLGFALAPMRDGQVVKPDVFNAWPEADRASAQKAIAELQDDLRDVLEQMPRHEKDRRGKARELDKEFAAVAVDQSLDELRRAFSELPEISAHIDAARVDMVENAGLFMAAESEDDSAPKRNESAAFRRYQINVIVSNGGGESAAPLIYEDNPTLPNLLGRIEHLQQMGTLVTDFMLIKPGALHAANGGYLLVDARKVLTEPLAWEGLKRAMRNGRIAIESLADHLSLVSTASLEPEPIPFSAKVVLFGERLIYYLLCQLDPDFPDIFKVAVDFDDEVAWEDERVLEYARLIAAIANKEKLLPFDRSGVSRMVEYAARLAEDAKHFSVRLGPIADLAREADHWARQEKARSVSQPHVARAEREQMRRLDRLREKSREAVSRDILLIDTEGAKVGQVNGLSVLSLGAYSFGRPNRITARIRLGPGRVVDIERETELGGPLHSKGVLILSGLLAARYALDWPISLSASLVFEQSYGGVEGDSASAAELCALLSAISEIPIRQELAITGSINQFGQIQAIGGVNQKIEGFFEVCRERGLTGRQGVIVPHANVQHLMLHDDVVQECRDGRFAVYAVTHVDEAMALFTGREAGARDSDGQFPEETVNRLVEDRLVELAKRRQALGNHGLREETGEDRDVAGERGRQ